MVESYTPRRGDVVWLSFQPQAGHEQAGRRPALVLSPESYNGRVGLALFCPIARQVKGYPFEVLLPEGLGVGGVILTDQLKSWDWRVRQGEFIARIPTEIMDQVVGKLSALIEDDV